MFLVLERLLDRRKEYPTRGRMAALDIRVLRRHRLNAAGVPAQARVTSQMGNSRWSMAVTGPLSRLLPVDLSAFAKVRNAP